MAQDGGRGIKASRTVRAIGVAHGPNSVKPSAPSLPAARRRCPDGRSDR